jgi:hypothetical protein
LADLLPFCSFDRYTMIRPDRNRCTAMGEKGIEGLSTNLMCARNGASEKRP